MNRTLPFYDHLMSLARHFQRIGLTRKANALFEHLTTLPGLSNEYVEEIHFRLAEWNLDEGRFKKARRHLAAALAEQPDNAHYHYLMGLAAGQDEECDPRRGLTHFRRALRLDPDNPSYLCEHGQLAVSLGEMREGVKSLRRAAELEMEDPELLTAVARGLVDAGRASEARSLVRIAMFRNPRDARFRQAWAQLQFEVLHGEQQEQEHRWTTDSPKPVLLPFPTPPRRKAAAGARVIRQDDAQPLRGPHGVKKTRRPARKSN